jgi:hypothetical protein
MIICFESVIDRCGLKVVYVIEKVLILTGFNNRCEFNKNLTNKTNIKLWEIVVSKLTQRKDFFECNVNFLKEWKI